MENWSDVVMGADRWFPDNRSPPIFKGGTLEMKKTGTKAVKIFKGVWAVMEQKTGLRVHAKDLLTMFPQFSIWPNIAI